MQGNTILKTDWSALLNFPHPQNMNCLLDFGTPTTGTFFGAREHTRTVQIHSLFLRFLNVFWTSRVGINLSAAKPNVLQPAKLAVAKPNRTRSKIIHKPRGYRNVFLDNHLYFAHGEIPVISFLLFFGNTYQNMERDGTFPSPPIYPSHDSSSSTAIYFCSICDKPFTNGRNFSGACILAPSNLTFWAATSRERHFRYCGRHTRHRPRSCRACNAAKTKCSFEVPCLRCTKRGIDCAYDDSVAAGRRTLPRLAAAAAHTVRVEPCRESITSLAFGASHADDGIFPNEEFASADDLGMNDTQVQFISSNNRQPVDLTAQRSPLKDFLTFDELFALEDDILSQHQCSADFSLALHNNMDQKSASWCTWMRGNVSLAVVTENLSEKSNSNLLAVVQLRRPHAQHNADLIIQSLRSFPTMMLRRETFPWFIHPHSQLLSKTTGAVSEALSNCMSIAQLFASRTPETKHFFRQTIGAEHRRFTSQVRFSLTSCSYNADCQKDASNVQIRTPCRNASLHDLFDYVHY